MKNCFKVLLLLGALALVPAFASAQAKPETPAKAAQPAAAQMPRANSADYVIGESDVLAINVWHEQELSRVLPVRADGKISLPLIGDLVAGGTTPAQLQASIVEKLRTFMENPEVTVIVQEPRSQYFTVVGEVLKPGAYPLGQRLSVLDGLAMAGGFKDFAKVKKMYILRTNSSGTTEKMPFDYKKALGGNTEQNFTLTARDTIVVP
ncbi:MAG: polysaccharide biosynthesis/export family protein [Candidatus Korobacteraceae bacterium]|jgi:polysaccharide export outer membrane protein